MPHRVSVLYGGFQHPGTRGKQRSRSVLKGKWRLVQTERGFLVQAKLPLPLAIVSKFGL